jgi:hypothetical protein
MLLLQGPDLGELSQPGSPYDYLDVTITKEECCRMLFTDTSSSVL